MEVREQILQFSAITLTNIQLPLVEARNSVAAGTGTDGTDSLSDVEFGRFADGTYEFATGIFTKTVTEEKKEEKIRYFKPVVLDNGRFEIFNKVDIKTLFNLVTETKNDEQIDPHAFFGNQLKTADEINEALDALDQLLRQIQIQQSVLSKAETIVLDEARRIQSEIDMEQNFLPALVEI